jgi:uncharacterized protein (DUF608 family)
MSDPLKRRQFLKLTTGTALSGVFLPSRSRAEESIGAIYQRIVPARKGLDAAWALSLAKRGARLDAGIACSEKSHLAHIGMTVGGIGCGTVYLTGDGRLFVWDIFHEPHAGVVAQKVKVPAGLENIAGAGKLVRELDGSNYISPPTPESHPNPFKQGFSLKLDGNRSRSMDAAGWSKVEFTGRWPLGIIEYSDPACPLEVRLESWTPFIPLSTLDSSLPVTVMEYTLENKSDKAVTGQFTGEWENPVLVHTRKRRKAGVESRFLNESGITMLIHQAAVEKVPAAAKRDDIEFEDFEKEDYGGWTVEGNAFGAGPVAAGSIPAYQGKVGGKGKRLVNSHASAPGGDVGGRDNAKGVLTSPEFGIVRRHIRLLLGGGHRPGETGVEVVVDGKVVASATGRENNRMTECSMDVSAFEGRKARLRIIDRADGAWGNTGADQIVFSDTPAGGGELKEAPDYGTAALTLLGGHALAGNGTAGSELTAGFSIPPSGKTTIRFLLTWHFPNMRDLPGLGKQVPQHAARFPDAAAVAREVADRFDELRGATMRWVATWNDSTLPQWLLDRSILTTNTLQTTNCHVLANGRFWAWEGIGCCAGTCAHVWHYAQGVARLFPDLERNLREVTDFGVAMNADGSIRFRAEAAGTVAIDAQTGIILRTWREHLGSPNSDFLKRVWPGAKRALEWLVRFDENGRGGLDGLLDGMQHNTLDAEWYGKVHCLCSLYLAALLAGRGMALETGDKEFAVKCEKLHAMGSEKIATLFNGEFYIQEEDPAHAGAIGVGQGCYIDQVIGQWWATQVGLGRLYDSRQIRSALHSLWRYNFVPEIGSFRQVFKLGRFYAMPNEAGLIMCTWPKGGLRDDFKKHWQCAYFNECMSGFEWQAAAHMIQEGAAINAADFEKTGDLLENPEDPRSLTARGLAVGRAIHDRYSASKRNPYNEIECSDHYGRANASYSMFLAACGFSYNGPAGVIGFDPKIGPEDFKAPFTAAEGWGTFEQKKSGKGWSARIKVAQGKLVLNEIRLPWIAAGGTVRLGDDAIAATAGKGVMTFGAPVVLTAGGQELVLSAE